MLQWWRVQTGHWLPQGRRLVASRHSLPRCLSARASCTRCLCRARAGPSLGQGVDGRQTRAPDGRHRITRGHLDTPLASSPGTHHACSSSPPPVMPSHHLSARAAALLVNHGSQLEKCLGRSVVTGALNGILPKSRFATARKLPGRSDSVDSTSFRPIRLCRQYHAVCRGGKATARCMPEGAALSRPLLCAGHRPFAATGRVGHSSCPQSQA